MTITISLNQIRAHNSCQRGWDTLLAARGGEHADYDQQFPLAEIIDSNGLYDAIWALRCIEGGGWIAAKIAVIAARSVSKYNNDPRVQAAIDAAEKCIAAPTPENISAARAAAYAAGHAADAEITQKLRELLE